MNMTTKKDLANAISAYDHACGEAQKWGEELVDAITKHEQLTPGDSDSVFMRKAERAKIAYSNWLKSAQLARKVLEEIHSKG